MLAEETHGKTATAGAGRSRVRPVGTDPRKAIAPAAAHWDLFQVEVARSHRGFPVGTLITGAKLAVALGLRPVHRHLLGPQRAFNQQLLEFVSQLADGRFSAGVGLSSYVRSNLEERMVATRTVDADNPGLGLAARVLEPALARQREWNRRATEIVLQLLEDEHRAATPEVHCALRDLQALVHVPTAGELQVVSRLAFPLWVELFRRQEQFNSAVTHTLAALYGLPAPADDGAGWYPDSELEHERSRQELVAQQLSALKHRPLISIITPTYAADRRWLEACVDSLVAQSYENWELCLVDDGSPKPETQRLVESMAARDPRIRVRCNPKNQGIALATNDCLKLATGEFVAFLDHDDTLAPNALGEVALHLAQHPETDLLFSDEDRLDEDGRRILPFYKPGWSPDLLLAVNYICHFLVVRRALLQEVGGLRPGFDGAQDFDLVLRVTPKARRVGHVPEVLYHWRATPQSTALNVTNKPKAGLNGVKALKQHLEGLGVRGIVHSPAPTQYQVLYEVPEALTAQVVVAGSGRVREVQRAIDGAVEAKGALVVVSERPPETGRHLPWQGPFDLGAMYERARREVPGEVYVFVHEDVELSDKYWLRELVAQALRPEIGVVGPKVIHPDSTIQEVGWYLDGRGEPVRPFADMADADQWTTMGTPNWTRNYLAVSPVCFAVRASVLSTLGGFRSGLAGAGAVLDLCLRAHDAGLRVLYTPHARITHVGNAARPDERPAGLGVPRKDPFFNPHLRALAP